MAQTTDFDLIIQNGKVVDGSGNPWFAADIGIRQGRIATIGDLADCDAASTIDATDRIVSPGFIDIHNHSDFTILAGPQAHSQVTQGVTTMVVGNCGTSAAPWNTAIAETIGLMESEIAIQKISELGIKWESYSEYLQQVEKRGCAANIATLVGHNNVRTAVLGWDSKAPDEKELKKMQAYVAEAMEAGAFGISFGLFYPPGFFA